MPSRSARTAVLVVAVLAAGCVGPDVSGHATPTTVTTTSEPPASAQIYDVLDTSPRVATVLVDDTYVYERGCFDGENESAVAYIRTGFHYESNGDGGRTAVGGRLYRVRIDLATEQATAVDPVESISAQPDC